MPSPRFSACLVAIATLAAGVESFRSLAATRGAVHRRHDAAASRWPSPSHPGLPTRTNQPSRPLHQLHSTTPSDVGDVDPLVLRASRALRASSWFSWWSQLILTVISTITFFFAKNVMNSQTTSPVQLGQVASKFFLPGMGIVASSISIVWTWGQRRLARRFVRKGANKVEAANLLRRVIKFGAVLNLAGLLTSVLGAQYIVGTLVAKSMQNVVGFGGGIGGGVVASQTLQPLDVLVVQANTNVLSSHFVSLACLLWLTRMVDLLDPPSLDEDDA